MDDQTFFNLMVDLHRDGARQGPGSDEETLRALELTRLDGTAELRVADIGCGSGIAAWRPFLRPGGVIAVSEITWPRPEPPGEIGEHWDAEYPEIATAHEKIALLEEAGYDLLRYFVFPSTCWTNNHYEPTGKRIPAFLERHADSPEAEEIGWHL